jgi:Endonuclease/Exonuclease/phosphatase family
MKVVSWNLNHRVREKRIPDDLGDLLLALGADVIPLNEFVDGPTRAPFFESLRSIGYVHQLVSRTPAQNNQVFAQVFAAARYPFSLGDLAPPPMDGYSIAGFLHIRFDHTPIELVGFRVPCYKWPADRRMYWGQLLDIMEMASTRAIVFAGDLNANPFAEAGTPEVPGVHFGLCKQYWVPNPTGDWSYVNYQGTASSRIDHILHTGTISVGDATYLSRLGDRQLAGPGSTMPISDHAVLTFTVNLLPHGTAKSSSAIASEKYTASLRTDASDACP